MFDDGVLLSVVGVDMENDDATLSVRGDGEFAFGLGLWYVFVRQCSRAPGDGRISLDGVRTGYGYVEWVEHGSAVLH